MNQNRQFRGIPIILLARDEHEADEEKAKASGATACFVKQGKYENAVAFFLSAFLSKAREKPAGKD